MRFYVLLFVFCVSHLLASAELSEKDVKRLQRNVEVAGARISDYKNRESREKFQVLEINTFQDQDATTGFRIYLAVELTDKNKVKYLVEFTGSPSDDYDSAYQGEDYWKLYVPIANFDQLKITGYFIQYGIMDGETFVPLAERMSKVKTLDELKKRATTPFPGPFNLQHYYMYDDQTEGVQESIPRMVKALSK